MGDKIMAGTFKIVNNCSVNTYGMCWVEGTSWKHAIGKATANGGEASYSPPNPGSKSFGITFYNNDTDWKIQKQLKKSYKLDSVNNWTFYLTSDASGNFQVKASASGPQTIRITNQTRQTVKYGVWWAANAQNQSGLLKPGQETFYVDSGGKFKIAFYQNSNGIIGQSLQTPLGYQVILTQANGGYGIVRQKINSGAVSVQESQYAQVPIGLNLALIQSADDHTKGRGESRISESEAKEIIDQARDSEKNIIETHKRTLAYIYAKHKLTRGAKELVVKALS